MSDTIPPAILAHVARAVAIIGAWKAGITLARDTYAQKRRRQRLERALQALAFFEARAQALGLPIEMLYAAYGGKPGVVPEVPHPGTTGDSPAASSPAGTLSPASAGTCNGRGQPAAPGAAPTALS
jgi:hypothetical protein